MQLIKKTIKILFTKMIPPLFATPNLLDKK